MLEITALTLPGVRVSILAAGIFFSSGLLTGAWKYFCIARSANALAPVYVDIAHRTSLLYSFAAILLAHFAALSAYSPETNFWAAAIPLVFFGAAIFGYIVHGILNDTDNQLRKPHKVGNTALPRGSIAIFMWLLMAGEIGGFAVLFAGVLKRICELNVASVG